MTSLQVSSSDVETLRGVGISRKSSVTSLAVLGVEINIWRCLKSSGWSCWGTGGNTGQRRINGNIIKKSIQCVNARLGPSCLTSSLELHIVTTKVTLAKSSFVPEYFTPLTPPPSPPHGYSRDCVTIDSGCHYLTTSKMFWK